MLLARVEGNVVATRKHPSFEGWRFVICQPINGAGEPEGAPQVAIDPHRRGHASAGDHFLRRSGRAQSGGRQEESSALDDHGDRGRERTGSSGMNEEGRMKKAETKMFQANRLVSGAAAILHSSFFILHLP